MSNTFRLPIFKNMDFLIPEGFERISWENVQDGQTVYTAINAATCLPDRVTFGPFVVVDKAKRVLRNTKGREFYEFPETLLIKN